MNTNNTVAARLIEKHLRKALLQDGPMQQALYEFELEENLDYWYQGLKDDNDQFVFAVTERDGDVAMVLITKAHFIYINEQARAKLAEIWPKVYRQNIKRLLPLMAQDLTQGFIAVNGVKTA